MARRRAWLLNFDAEDELARPVGYTPSQAMRARATVLAPQVSELLGEGDVLLTPDGPAVGEAFEGRAWCPTPRVLRAWRAAGVKAPSTPPLAVLQRVNHRAFCAALGAMLPGACFVTDAATLERVLAAPSPTGSWLLKRAFGYTGRGRLKLGPAAPDARERAWIAASLAPGAGLQVEPWVERTADFGLHGYLHATGTLTLGEPTAQTLTPTGAWSGTERAGTDALAPAELRALVAAAEESAEALRGLGYFGPFGIDAFRWRDAHGALRFNPRCEINARYSMGWAVGMGPHRPDLETG
jgi:hypothetical protein